MQLDKIRNQSQLIVSINDRLTSNSNISDLVVLAKDHAGQKTKEEMGTKEKKCTHPTATNSEIGI